jgi:hypothetical protein
MKAIKVFVTIAIGAAFGYIFDYYIVSEILSIYCQEPVYFVLALVLCMLLFGLSAGVLVFGSVDGRAFLGLKITYIVLS